jgi:hypothetical protein
MTQACCQPAVSSVRCARVARDAASGDNDLPFLRSSGLCRHAEDPLTFAALVARRYAAMSAAAPCDFIEVYENALDAPACKALIERFHASDRVGRGAMGGGVDTSMKDSWDISIAGDAKWADAEGLLNRAMLRGLLSYLRKYPYTILGPVWLRMRDPDTGTSSLLDPEQLVALDDLRLQALVMKAFRPGNINIQRYLADQGGYPRWHCEVYPNTRNADALSRTLLWTIYLNDAFAEGETEFYHQQRKITPKTGSLLIAPAAFTHTHRGNTPRGGDKYIATSWVLFQRSEAIYAAPPSAQ